MSLGFGEDGDAGDRVTVNRQATQEHEVYPGSGPQRKNPTPACLLLITAEPKVTKVRRCNLAWRCVCGGMRGAIIRSVDLLCTCPSRWTLLAFIYGGLGLRYRYELVTSCIHSSLEVSL